MTEEIVFLNAPNRRPPEKTQKLLYLGRRYRVDASAGADDEHCLCAGFDESLESGGSKLLADGDEYAFLWDIGSGADAVGITLFCDEKSILLNANTPVGAIQFVLSDSRLSAPKIVSGGVDSFLSFDAEFDIVCSSEDMSARLGVLHLLDATCFVTLENGDKHSLFQSDEDESVLFLADRTQSTAIKPVCDITQGDPVMMRKHLEKIQHHIPETINGISVESMTVLEQYRTYFMQREIPFTRENIWTPVCAPISWGWSIRMNRREDDEWTITRQKLLNPTVGHNGLEMPHWETYKAG